MLPQSGGYAQKTTLVGIRVSDDEDPKGLQFFLTNPPISVKSGCYDEKE